MRFARIFMSMVTVLATIATALVIASVAAAPSSAASPSTSSNSGARVQVRSVSSTYDYQVLYWTNVMRKRYGLRPLKAGPCVDRFAEGLSARMASRDTFGHQALRPILRRCHRHRAAENIAYGTGSLSAYRVVQMWMHSAGHRKNILNRKYKALGVGTWRSADSGRIYVTQDFAG